LKRITVTLDDESYAHTRQYDNTSDYIRGLIRADMGSHPVSIDRGPSVDVQPVFEHQDLHIQALFEELVQSFKVDGLVLGS
jgi:hypothetical protein